MLTSDCPDRGVVLHADRLGNYPCQPSLSEAMMANIAIDSQAMVLFFVFLGSAGAFVEAASPLANSLTHDIAQAPQRQDDYRPR